MNKGFFITFEGSEGAGKSTHIKNLSKYFSEIGKEVVVTREPGGTGLGEELRKLIKYYSGEDSVCNESELLMFGASRAQLMQKIILPQLNNNGVVISDRFVDSTTVYQGFGRGLDFKFIEQLHSFSMNNRWPDLTILLDLPVEVSFERINKRTGAPGDRIEAESKEFFEKIRQSFLELSRIYPERFLVVDSTKSKEEVSELIRNEVEKRLLAHEGKHE